MITFDEVKKYLPQYLSTIAQNDLFSELKQFPENIDKRLYTTRLASVNNIFQGDGLKDLLCVFFPDHKIGPMPSMVLSNSCDIDPANSRHTPARVVYAPILKLSKYKDNITRDHVNNGNKTIDAITTHISDIKKQRITNIFYLPIGGNLEEDSIVFFDRLNNFSIDSIEIKSIQERKLFTLSDYGLYLFLFKLSVHFTRIREGLNRSTQDSKKP